MSTTTHIRFADLDGMTVIAGPLDQLESALAAGEPITIDGQRVTLTGEIEIMDDGTPLCDFAERTPISRTTRQHHGRECVTGGNCSSHGDGRSCGGYDCDGYEL